MAENSKIEWTHHTFNPWWGCVKVSDGCKNCYADSLDRRYGGNHWGVNAERRFFGDKHWNEPLKWNKEAEAAGERRRVFCASMADVFEVREDLAQERTRLFELIRSTPHLDWLLLTKRPETIGWLLHQSCEIASQLRQYWDTAQWISDWTNGKPPANVWIGTSVENQEQADKRIPHLLHVPTKVRFLSMEPLLGPVDLGLRRAAIESDYAGYSGDGPIDYVLTERAKLLHWVITGGESGHHARPSHPDWFRDIRDQCEAAGIAYFHKQWGEWMPISEMQGESLNLYHPAPENDPEAIRRCKVQTTVLQLDGTMGHNFPQGAMQVFRVGKKAAGRLLDGRTWDEVPTPCEANQ